MQAFHLQGPQGDKGNQGEEGDKVVTTISSVHTLLMTTVCMVPCKLHMCYRDTQDLRDRMGYQEKPVELGHRDQQGKLETLDLLEQWESLVT